MLSRLSPVFRHSQSLLGRPSVSRIVQRATFSSSQSPANFIADKRYGKEHTTDEINHFIREFHLHEVMDYQMSAWLMAVCINGMSARETADLTRAMVESGDIADLSDVPGVSVDKHSTGGVGDKISLILAPLVASFGLIVPMMSGRGLGHTGGTLDKLESIPGFNCDLSMKDFKRILREVGVAMISPAGDMAPVDKRVYALRDVTSTVRAIPLQTSSIMCKKLAENPDSLVLDVKFGLGAFNQEVTESIELAKSMVGAGERVGKQTTAFITRMDQPIGFAVGNWFEVVESIKTLEGEGPADLTTLCLVQGGQMLVQGGVAKDLKEGIGMCREQLKNGKALEKFYEMVGAQGGDVDIVKNVKKYHIADHFHKVKAAAGGVVVGIDALVVGNACVDLGAGRRTVEQNVDFMAGVKLRKKCGDAVEEGEVIAEVYTNIGSEICREAGKRVLGAYQIDAAGDGTVCELITHVVTIDSVVAFDKTVLE